MMSRSLKRILGSLVSLSMMSAQVADAAYIRPKPVTPAPVAATPAPAATATAPVLPIQPINTAVFAQQKKVADAFNNRNDFTFTTPQSIKDFQTFIDAYKDALVIGNTAKFFVWWTAQKETLIQKYASVKGMTWALFLDASVREYQIALAKASGHPEAFARHVDQVVAQPQLKMLSFTSYLINAAIYSATIGLGWAIYNGIAKEILSATYDSVRDIVNDKVGTHATRIGSGLSGRYFTAERMTEMRNQINRATIDLAEAMKPLLDDDGSMTPERSNEVIKDIQAKFVTLGEIWNTFPDAYRKAHDKFTELVSGGSSDFNQSITASITAAEVQRQGADGIVNQLVQRQPVNTDKIQDLAEDIRAAIVSEMNLNVEQPEVASLRKQTVDILKARLVALSGGRPDQVDRLETKYRAEFTFARQTAGFLAAEMFYQPNSYDLSTNVDSSFRFFSDTNSNSFFRKEFSQPIRSLLNQVRVQMSLLPIEAPYKKPSFIKATLDKLRGRAAATDLNKGPTVVDERTAKVINMFDRSPVDSHAVDNADDPITRAKSKTPTLAEDIHTTMERVRAR